jgi:hypothetical protein
MIHHNQTKKLTTLLLNFPLDESINNKKHKVWISNPRPHKAQLDDQKSRKDKKGHLEEGKTTSPTKGMKSGKPSKMARKS